MSTHLLNHSGSKPSQTPRCPCGNGPPIDMQTSVSHSNLCQYANSLRLATSPRAPRDTWTPSLVDVICDHARALACPHCQRHFVDFDGCAAILCHCGGAFCALCLTACADSHEAHAHVLACPKNPTNTYYVPMDLCRIAWTRRARQRMRSSLAEVARRDGLAVATGLLCSVACRAPDLLAPFPCKITHNRTLRSCMWALVRQWWFACMMGGIVGLAQHTVFSKAL